MLAAAEPGAFDTGLMTFLLLSVFVIALAYVTLRYFGNWQMKQTKGRRMRVLEALPVGRDRQLLLVAVGKNVLVLGSSSNGVSLVHELEAAEAGELLAEPGPAAPRESKAFPDFETSIRESLGKMRGLMKRESNDDKWRQP